MRFTRLFLAVAAPVVIACGMGASQAGPHGGGGGSGSDGGPDAGCPNSAPSILCYGCNGSTVDLVCIDGAWECPGPAPCPSPPPCSGPEPSCTGCNGESIGPQCVGDIWQCPVLGCPIELDAGCGTPPPDLCTTIPPCDGGSWELLCTGSSWTCSAVCPASDAGPPDANPQPFFSCVDIGCDPQTSYCQLTTGGPVIDDGGGFGAQCIPLPSTCASGAATCACVQATQGVGCSCVEQHGDVTVTCEVP
jgi:hypothetical protein